MKGELSYRKTHPYSFIKHLRISILLILLSVLQQLLVQPLGILAIIASLGVNALYVFVVIGYYMTDYQNLRYRQDRNGISIRRGVIIHKKYRVPYRRIHTVVFYRSALSSMFGAEKISADTPAGSQKKYDISGYFSNKKAREFRRLLFRDQEASASYKAKPIGLILISALWSNPITGLVFIVPIILGAGQLLGREMTRALLTSSVRSQYQWTAYLISPLARVLASLIILCWAISMLVVFMRYAGFRSARVGGLLVITRGFLSRSMTCIRTEALSAVHQEQSLLMKLMHLRRCSVSVVGSGKMKTDRGLLVCAEESRVAKQTMSELTGIELTETAHLRPAKGTLFSYVLFPLSMIVLTLVLLPFSNMLPIISRIGNMFLILLLLAEIWWLFFRLFAHRRACIAQTETHAVIGHFQRLTMKKTYIPFEKLQCIEIRQNPVQKKFGTCSLKVYLYGEKKFSCLVKHFWLSEVQQIAGEWSHKIKPGDTD